MSRRPSLTTLGTKGAKTQHFSSFLVVIPDLTFSVLLSTTFYPCATFWYLKHSNFIQSNCSQCQKGIWIHILFDKSYETDLFLSFQENIMWYLHAHINAWLAYEHMFLLINCLLTSTIRILATAYSWIKYNMHVTHLHLNVIQMGLIITSTNIRWYCMQ